jgi:hypothetical protein
MARPHPATLTLLALLASTAALEVGCAASAIGPGGPRATGTPAATEAPAPDVTRGEAEDASFPVVHRVAQGVSVKRRAPAPVPPLAFDGIQYSVPHFMSQAAGMSHPGGYLEATRIPDGRRLWLRELFRYAARPELEQDVQAVFITGLRREGATLVVTDERGARYVLPLGAPTEPGPPDPTAR